MKKWKNERQIAFFKMLALPLHFKVPSAKFIFI